MPESKEQGPESNIEILKFKLERARYRSEIFKWIIIAIGAAVSFWVIDNGKLRLEKARFDSDNQYRLIESYSKATEAVEPEIWKRKLEVLNLFATDQSVRTWLTNKLNYINAFGALDALYRETLKSASQLVDPATVNNPERMKARSRYEQLYWADLPFAGESQEVVRAMIEFRKALVAAEQKPSDSNAWDELNTELIELSATLREEIRKASGSPIKGAP